MDPVTGVVACLALWLTYRLVKPSPPKPGHPYIAIYKTVPDRSYPNAVSAFHNDKTHCILTSPYMSIFETRDDGQAQWLYLIRTRTDGDWGLRSPNKLTYDEVIERYTLAAQAVAFTQVVVDGKITIEPNERHWLPADENYRDDSFGGIR